MSVSRERLLPDREIAYNYTVAMLFAQEMEVNLRAILLTVHYSFKDLDDSLSENELDRFKSFERFLGKAAIGSLKLKIRSAGIMFPRKAWRLLNDGCKVRNELAHRYLEGLRLPLRRIRAKGS